MTSVSIHTGAVNVNLKHRNHSGEYTIMELNCRRARDGVAVDSSVSIYLDGLGKESLEQMRDAINGYLEELREKEVSAK